MAVIRFLAPLPPPPLAIQSPYLPQPNTEKKDYERAKELANIAVLLMDHGGGAIFPKEAKGLF